MFLKVAGATLGTIAMAGALSFYDGAITLRVEEHKADGTNLRLVVPASAVSLGVWLAPEEKLREAAAKSRDVLPALKVAARELERCPDFVLVEVQNPREHVRIEKRGGRLLIDVESPDETVRVGVPLGTVETVARRLQDLNPPS
jgi:hypothetical protein